MPAQRLGIALLPLRLFLGGTFVYAGIQKLSDSGFLHAGSPTYIGTQLQGFADGTPGGFILHAFAIPHPVLAGVGVAIVEIVIGLLAALGLLTRLAAAGGLALSVLLFLTASWHTTPYFLGPDIVFAFAWLPFVLAGAAEQPALDNVLKNPSPALIQRVRLGAIPGEMPAEREAALTRRALVAEVGVVAVGLAGLSALLKGNYALPAAANTGTDAPGSTANAPAAAGGGGDAVPSNAIELGPASQLAAGQAATYSDPVDGADDIIIRQTDGSLSAFSAVCTHAGCTVGFEGGVIACPCHGATFNAQTGAVEGGPASSALAAKQVVEHAGKIYAVPS